MFSRKGGALRFVNRSTQERCVPRARCEPEASGRSVRQIEDTPYIVFDSVSGRARAGRLELQGDPVSPMLPLVA
jgi:hypothetical protein